MVEDFDAQNQELADANAHKDALGVHVEGLVEEVTSLRKDCAHLEAEKYQQKKEASSHDRTARQRRDACREEYYRMHTGGTSLVVEHTQGGRETLDAPLAGG